jgi:hypothetical protein
MAATSPPAKSGLTINSIQMGRLHRKNAIVTGAAG